MHSISAVRRVGETSHIWGRREKNGKKEISLIFCLTGTAEDVYLIELRPPQAVKKTVLSAMSRFPFQSRTSLPATRSYLTTTKPPTRELAIDPK